MSSSLLVTGRKSTRQRKSNEETREVHNPNNKRKPRSGNTSEVESEEFSESEYEYELIETPKTIKHKDESKLQTSNKSYSLVLISIVFVVASVIFYQCFCQQKEIKAQKEINILYLQKQFTSQPNETWEDIETIIEDVLSTDPIHPAVFLFLFTGENRDSDRIVESIAEYASQKLDVDDKHIVLDENEYKNKEAQSDYGYLIHKYKPDLAKKRVMIIKNLHKMSGIVAQVLHSFCDEIEPLVDRAIYILTLKVNSLLGNELTIAEESLKKEWSNLENDKLIPLITRVTSTVIKIL